MSKKEKIAPVQGWPQGIPWSLHLEAYAVYCQRWGEQEALIDLEGRNCRGGFSVGELDEWIPGWREKVSEIYKLREAIAKKDAALKACVEAYEKDDQLELDAAITQAQEARKS